MSSGSPYRDSSKPDKSFYDECVRRSDIFCKNLQEDTLQFVLDMWKDIVRHEVENYKRSAHLSTRVFEEYFPIDKDKQAKYVHLNSHRKVVLTSEMIEILAQTIKECGFNVTVNNSLAGFGVSAVLEVSW